MYELTSCNALDTVFGYATVALLIQEYVAQKRSFHFQLHGEQNYNRTKLRMVSYNTHKIKILID